MDKCILFSRAVIKSCGLPNSAGSQTRGETLESFTQCPKVQKLLLTARSMQIVELIIYALDLSIFVFASYLQVLWFKCSVRRRMWRKGWKARRTRSFCRHGSNVSLTTDLISCPPTRGLNNLVKWQKRDGQGRCFSKIATRLRPWVNWGARGEEV